MKYPAYPEYKNDKAMGGLLPKHWSSYRLKFLVELRNEKLDAEVSELPYMGLEHIESWTCRKLDDEEASAEGVASRVLPGDVLFGRLRPYLAKVYLAEHEGLASTEALVMISGHQLMPRFLKYLLVSPRFIDLVSGGSYGSKMPRASWDHIGSITVAIPTADEQQQIADFLDWRTAQIDALIAKKRALQSAIEEQCLSAISNSVTSNRTWPKRRLRTLLTTLTSGSRGWAEYFANNGPLFLRITNLRRDDPSLLLDDLQRVNPPESAEGLRTCTQAGDLLVSITADLGSVAVIPNDLEPAYVSQHLALVRVEKDKVNPYWVAYSMLSSFGRQQLQAGGYGGTKVQLGLDDIKEFVLYLPPSLEEQDALVRELANELERLKTLREQIENAINRLTEYRSALITAAVTGQIDVRGVRVPAAA